jgi:hypothetical protein
MVRWLKIVWHVVRGPALLIGGLVAALVALMACGLLCVSIFGQFERPDGHLASYGVSALVYSLRTLAVLMVLLVGALPVGAWWTEVGRLKAAEAREMYPAPPKTSSEPGDIEVVSGGDLEMIDG